MKNIAIIFAGGTGQRLSNASRPKQFLEYNGKPVIIYTLEVFEQHPKIDGIVIACIESWIPFLQQLLKKYNINKVTSIVPGGRTGQDSIYNALVVTSQYYSSDSIVLIHDAVRPLITEHHISDCICMAENKGNCISCVRPTETYLLNEGNDDVRVPSRNDFQIARAPQCFVLSDILSAHQMAISEHLHDFIDSCTMMLHYGHKMHTILGSDENIKITTVTDFFLFRALMQLRENLQAFE